MVLLLVFMQLMRDLFAIAKFLLVLLGSLLRRIYYYDRDDREHLFLFQRISVAIQRFNAVLPHDGFPSEDHPD